MQKQSGILPRSGDTGPCPHRSRRLQLLEKQCGEKTGNQNLDETTETDHTRQIYHKEVHRDILCGTGVDYRHRHHLRHQ